MNFVRACVVKNLNIYRRLASQRCFTTTRSSLQTGERKTGEPIKFTTSGADQLKAKDTFSSNRRDAPTYERYIISLSCIALMVYFCILREENDVDEALGRGLFDHLPQMEEQQLKVTLEYQKMHGQDTSLVQSRLDKLQKEKSG